MTLAIVLIAAVTVLLTTVMIAAAISTRPTRPCLFSDSTIYTSISRFDGGKCSGKPDNVYLSSNPVTVKLHGVRVCNGHMTPMLDVADALVRESK